MPPNFIVALILITLIIVGAHFFVYVAILHFWQLSGTLVLKITTFLISISFILLSILTSFFYSRILGGLYALSAVLLGTLYWLFWASLLGFIVFGILHFLGFSSTGLITGKILLIVGCLISLYGFIHSYDTKIVTYEVALKNLPDEWENKKIVLIGDTHLGNVRNVGFIKKIAVLVSAQKPDLVLIPGDFVDGPPTNTTQLVEAFSPLNASKGVYFANGNHETYHEQTELYEALAKAEIHILNDALMEVDGLQIIGANYPTTTSDANQSQVLDGLNIDPNKPAILIKHIPNALNSAALAGIDLQVSGHSHRGQVWPGPWLTGRVYGLYAYGMQKYNDMTVITTSGAGTWGPPQRVGTDGEIVVITLVKKD